MKISRATHSALGKPLDMATAQLMRTTSGRSKRAIRMHDTHETLFLTTAARCPAAAWHVLRVLQWPVVNLADLLVTSVHFRVPAGPTQIIDRMRVDG